MNDFSFRNGDLKLFVLKHTPSVLDSVNLFSSDYSVLTLYECPPLGLKYNIYAVSRHILVKIYVLKMKWFI